MNLLKYNTFTREIQSYAATHGLPAAITYVFKQCNITLVVEGDTSRWNNTGDAALLIGDHRSGYEKIPIMALFGKWGRRDIGLFGIPYGNSARITTLLNPKGTNHMLPVIPGIIAKDSKHFFGNPLLIHRIGGCGKIPSKQEAREKNAQTIKYTAKLLSTGYAVNISPHGSTKVSITGKWYNGIGKILGMIPFEDRKKIILVPYCFDNDYTKRRLQIAFIKRMFGYSPRPQRFTLYLGKQYTVEEIIREETNPFIITQKVRSYYLNSSLPGLNN